MINADKALYRIEIYRTCIKYTKMTKSEQKSKTHQKFDFGMNQ